MAVIYVSGRLTTSHRQTRRESQCVCVRTLAAWKLVVSGGAAVTSRSSETVFAQTLARLSITHTFSSTADITVTAYRQHRQHHRQAASSWAKFALWVREANPPLPSPLALEVVPLPSPLSRPTLLSFLPSLPLEVGPLKSS